MFLSAIGNRCPTIFNMSCSFYQKHYFIFTNLTSSDLFLNFTSRFCFLRLRSTWVCSTNTPLFSLKQFRDNCFKWHICGLIPFSLFHARLFTLWRLAQYLLWYLSDSQFLEYSGHSVKKKKKKELNKCDQWYKWTHSALYIFCSYSSIPGHNECATRSFHYFKQNPGATLHTATSVTYNILELLLPLLFNILRIHPSFLFLLSLLCLGSCHFFQNSLSSNRSPSLQDIFLKCISDHFTRMLKTIHQTPYCFEEKPRFLSLIYKAPHNMTALHRLGLPHLASHPPSPSAHPELVIAKPTSRLSQDLLA